MISLIKNRLKQFIRMSIDRQTAQKIGEMQNELQSLTKQLNEISIFIRPMLSKHLAIQWGLIKDEEDYAEEVARLKKNLAPDALARLEFILKTISYGETRNRMLLNEIYDQEQIKKFWGDKQLPKEVKKVDDYYQWKHYKLPINYFTPEVFLHRYGLDLIKTTVPEDSVIIDAGAFILDTALMFREYYPKNKIIAFEPCTQTYCRALRTQQLNNLQNVEVVNMGLGSKNEKSGFYIDVTNGRSDFGGGNHILDIRDGYNWEKETIQICTLDSYVRENSIPKIGLIKTDVEGFETQLLEGAIDTIKEHRPVLVLSIYHNYKDFYRIKPYLESLNLGYRFDFFSNKYEKTNTEIVLIAEAY